MRVTLAGQPPPTPPQPPFPCFLLHCSSAAALPAKAKWDHNYDVSALKTQPAECYNLTAFMAAVLHPPLPPTPPLSALRCFERSRLVSGESPAVGTNLPYETCLNSNGISLCICVGRPVLRVASIICVPKKENLSAYYSPSTVSLS